MQDMRWTTWTFKLGNVAFKDIRPRKMMLKPETVRVAVSTRWFFFKTYINVPTGRWAIALTFDKGPYTSKTTETVLFDTAAVAEAWFNEAFDKLFAGLVEAPTAKKKAPHLFLINNEEGKQDE